MNRMEAWKLLRNRWLVFSHDLLWIPVAIAIAFWIRLNLQFVFGPYWHGALALLLVALPVYTATFWIFGCYRGIWRFASVPDLVRIVKAVVLGALIAGLGAFLFTRLAFIPRSVLVVYPLLLILGLGGSRLVYRMLKDQVFHASGGEKQRALIVGAGQTGELLIRDLLHRGPFLPVALLDDDVVKRGHELHGVRICGALADIEDVARRYDIKIVLIALPSISGEVIERIVKVCGKLNISCRILPSLKELADGTVEASRLRPIRVEDLLGREPVQLGTDDILKFLRGKRVLVTGGGGSIGVELCRQVSLHDPALLAVLDNCEYNLYRVDQELSGKRPGFMFSSLLGDVRDAHAINALFEQFKPQVILHAAAYKHVPMVEDNIIEGIRNNVFGTRVVADAAQRYGVEAFILVSTDKTVNPTNVMGTTKRVAELYCQSLNAAGGTHFITTRFGNVLASVGSVIPLFERQIAAGGPVTVTHPEVTRYFMTIPEATSLILQASAIGKGGEIFVLDMGEPVRIADLAEKMIRLSGLEVRRDIEIVYTGLRPGEKLHEELFYAAEELRTTAHPKLLLANNHATDAGEIQAGLKALNEAVAAYDETRSLQCLKALVPEFQPSVLPEDRRQRRNRPDLRVVK